MYKKRLSILTKKLLTATPEEKPFIRIAIETYLHLIKCPYVHSFRKLGQGGKMCREYGNGE